MKKSELQALFRESQKRKTRPASDSTKSRKTGGCRSCGKVTWKPNQESSK